LSSGLLLAINSKKISSRPKPDPNLEQVTMGKKEIGQPESLTRDAENFLYAFRKCVAETQSNQAQIYQFFNSNRAQLTESLLEALPFVFAKFTADQLPKGRNPTARLLWSFGYWIKQFPLDDCVLNLELSITAYQLALQVYTREDFPQAWAMTQGNLASALVERAFLRDNSTDLDTAIILRQESLTIAVSGSPYFINAQYELGNALSRRYEHSQNSNDLQQALQAYKTALDAISPEHYDRKKMWQAIPATQSILGSRLVRDGQWQEGLQLLLNSINQLSTGDDPLAHANALFQTGRAHEILSDWDNARLYYRDALRLYEHLNNQPGIAKSCAGLGDVLVSQGHLENGMAQLAKAREHYHQLQRPNQAAELEHLYQVAQRAMEQQATEVSV
jgi:hypothetical protein